MFVRTAPRLAALFVATALSCPDVPWAQVLPHPPVVDRLPNGLSVVSVPFDSPGVAAYYTLVRTGSRDEVEAGHTGFAHLFEHMMFRGSRHYTAQQYELTMQRLGADNNAYTTEDFTLYTVLLPSASLPELIPAEADRFRWLQYTEAEFQTETRAVLGEYNRATSSPGLPMEEHLYELAFQRHTYAHTTLGYLRDIEAMPGYYRHSIEFLRRFYTPDNCTIIVAGDFDRTRVLDLVRQNYGAWRGHRATAVIAPEPEQTAPRDRWLAWEGASPRRLFQAYRVPAFGLSTADSAALEVVYALAFSPSSELYQRLVVAEQKLTELGTSEGMMHRDPGLFVIQARLAADVTFDEISAVIDTELTRIGRGAYPRERIEAVVSHLRYALPMSVQAAPDAAELVARMMALTGDPGTLEQYVARLSAVTADDVARVARTYLTQAHRARVMLASAADAPSGALRIGPGGRSSASSGPPTSGPSPSSSPPGT